MLGCQQSVGWDGEERPVTLDQSRRDAGQRDGSIADFAGVVPSPASPFPAPRGVLKSGLGM